MVVILIDYRDGTFRYTDPMHRWEAEWQCAFMANFGEYHGDPKPRRPVMRALLIPREEKVH